MRNDLNLPLTLLADLYCIAKISDTIIDLDLIMQEFLKRRDIEDLIRGRLRSVDDELQPISPYSQGALRFKGRCTHLLRDLRRLALWARSGCFFLH